MQAFAVRKHEKMKEVLMDAFAQGPDIYYYMIRGGKEKRNITIWECGKVGGEYIKAYGHYHVGQLDETYSVLSGDGMLLLQKRKIDKNGKEINDEIENFYAIIVKKGDEIYIPSGVGHLLLNTGSTWLTASDDSPVDFSEADPVSLPGHADYQSVKIMRGFAYYVVEKNGQPSFIKNANYKSVPAVTIISALEYNKLSNKT